MRKIQRVDFISTESNTLVYIAFASLDGVLERWTTYSPLAMKHVNSPISS